MIVKIDIENDRGANIRHFIKNTDVALPPSSTNKSLDGSHADSPEERWLQEWIERIIDRDQVAFSALYDFMGSRIYGLAIRITRNAPLAEEVTEDTFWQIWRHAPRFDPARGSAVSWILTIARSRALDALRKIEPTEINNAPELSADAVISGDNPPDLLAALQESKLLYAAMARLDPVPRQMLALAFFCGLSHEEIARHVSLPLGTVKSHIRRALIALRQVMTRNSDSNLGNI